jgi:membrane peptidoglycan carboxypeptidase
MSENARNKTTILLKLACGIVLAGLLVAGLFFPLVGGTGLVARNSADLINGLPTSLTVNIPPGNTRMLAADGSVITEFYTHNRTPVPSEKIAPIMKQALVDIEDSRFYEHNGIDVQGTLRALVTNVAAGSVQEGGSTLTQQLVKQTLLQTATTPQERQAAVQQSVGRKLREARLAMALDKKYSKDEILTRYLNIVYFGEGAYGIEAAAQAYFSTHADKLTLPQAAMLAGLVQSPSGDDPIANPQNATTRRNEVLKRMRDLGHITSQQMNEAAAQPVKVTPGQSPPNGCAEAAIAGYFCDYAESYVEQKLKIGADQLSNGGLTIQTSLQPKLQRDADRGILDNLDMGSPFAGVLDAVEPGTGRVLAMAANRQYGCSPSKGPQCESVNLNVVPQAGSGSTYKVFTAAYALSQGFGEHYTIYAPQPYTSHVYKNWDSNVGGYVPYRVWNDDPNYKSVYDMHGALVASANTYFVALEDALGSITGPVKISEAMGMHYDNAVTQESAASMIKNQRGPFTLGFNATSPLDLATAYATVASGGTRCDPIPVTKVLDQNGQPLKDANGQVIAVTPHCTKNAIPAGVARTLSKMLVDVVSPAGTGRRAIIPGHEIGGKTGTTQENKTAAFVGITPKYALSVMYFDPKGKQFVGGVGGGVPAQMFHDTMAPFLAHQPDTPFPPADPAVVAGNGKHQGYVPPAPQPTPQQSQGTGGGGTGGGGTGGGGTGGGGTGGGTGGGAAPTSTPPAGGGRGGGGHGGGGHGGGGHGGGGH